MYEITIIERKEVPATQKVWQKMISDDNPFYKEIAEKVKNISDWDNLRDIKDKMKSQYDYVETKTTMEVKTEILKVNVDLIDLVSIIQAIFLNPNVSKTFPDPIK